MMDKHSRVVAADYVTSADLGGEAVVLNLSAGVYFGVNEAGARIMQLIREPICIDDVVAALLKDYDVTRDQLESDVIAFIERLNRKEIVHVEKDSISHSDCESDC